MHPASLESEAGCHRMKLAFITPRYGGEIASGAEHACRLLAEQLSERHDVEVVTTAAGDPRTWKNEYGEGTDRVRGVLVRRFSVNQLHDANAFRQFSERILSAPRSRDEEMDWVRRLGPSTPRRTSPSGWVKAGRREP